MRNDRGARGSAPRQQRHYRLISPQLRMRASTYGFEMAPRGCSQYFFSIEQYATAGFPPVAASRSLINSSDTAANALRASFTVAARLSASDFVASCAFFAWRAAIVRSLAADCTSATEFFRRA